MKFDVCIGNPPYNSDAGTNLRNAKSIYPYFIIDSAAISKKIVMITPSRWFNGESKDSAYIDLRNFMKTNHLKSIVNYSNSKDIFPNANISGAISYFLYDSEYNGNVKFTNIIDENTSITEDRPLFNDTIDIILTDTIISNIVNKVKSKDNITSIINKLKLDNTKLNTVKDRKNNIAVYCANDVIKYINKNEISNEELLQNYFVYTSSVNGNAGILNNTKPVSILGKVLISKPNTITSDVFMIFGNYKNYSDAQKVQKYLSTKFVRFLVGVLKASHRLGANVYKLVPLENFTDSSEINWADNISEISFQLYKKYKLSTAEIDYIEKHIK